MRRRSTLLALAGAALLATGCARDATAPARSALDDADVALLAEEFDALAGAVLSGQFGALGSLSAAPAGAAPIPVSRTFTDTRPCPRGGSVTVSGTTTGEIDREARSLTLSTTATKTQTACAFQARRGQGVTLTVNGNPNIALASSARLVNGRPSGLQTLSQKGAFTWAASDGRSGSCTVDIVATFDPATRTRTVKGTVCGRPVDATR